MSVSKAKEESFSHTSEDVREELRGSERRRRRKRAQSEMREATPTWSKRHVCRRKEGRPTEEEIGKGKKGEDQKKRLAVRVVCDLV